MNKNTWLILALAVAIGLLVWFFMATPTNAPEGPDGDEQVEEEVDDEVDDEAEAPDEVTVTYTDDGFSPSVVTVAEGGTVHFVNQSSSAFWPASATHPTHTVYPGSDIELCATAALGILFDACGEVASGGTWSFTFGEGGEWGYHNHLDVDHFGRVVVE